MFNFVVSLSALSAVKVPKPFVKIDPNKLSNGQEKQRNVICTLHREQGM